MHFQDLTRHPEDGNGWGLSVADILAGAGIIALCCAAFVIGSVLFDKADSHAPRTTIRHHDRTITITTTPE